MTKTYDQMIQDAANTIYAEYEVCKERGKEARWELWRGICQGWNQSIGCMYDISDDEVEKDIDRVIIRMIVKKNMCI